MSPSNIILVGFMGTGKSAVGERLAARLDWEFIDLDRRVEAIAGRTIPEIFTLEGEAGFRDRESQLLRSMVGTSGAVMATGGGIMGRDENVRLLRDLGTLVCLTARPEVILERTRPWEDRPMLAGASNPGAVVDRLLEERADRYALAELAVDTSDLTVEDVVEAICRALT